ncbi:aminotransferase class III-fold pyridoxal phosphate-dependent enzyme [Candidatus Pelagibacter sp.]|jgi:glutamate-1-semialdehyde aminotransferase|nr:aminotransferase class III-fold pyridoxal phosphate-dependent enzyme [Candidatus Pelagibacter sp.]
MYKKYKKDTKKLQKYANSIIPGLSGILGKRPEMYLPGGKWPTYYSKSKGIEIYDLKNKKYLDFTMLGVGSCVFGYSDNEINKVAKKVINEGNLTTLNPVEEVELAELLIDIHPWAEQVKYSRTGGEMMSVAVRLARAATGRSKILFCGYHGWHDWYLSSNLTRSNSLKDHLLPGLEPLGVPYDLTGTVIPFKFNDHKDLKEVVAKNIKDSAAVILEPARDKIICKKFLSEIRKLCTKNNTVLIFDEITSAWRNDTSGIHREIGINPDMAAFGKTISNGIPMAALIGKKNIMEFAKKTFISSTNWSERLGPATALAFLKKHKRLKAGKILNEKGIKIREIWEKAANEAKLKIDISGIYPLSSFKIKQDNWPIIITYFIQEMLKKNILASDRCYSNTCQDKKSLKIYSQACHEVFYKIAKYNGEGILKNKLEGPIKQMGFTRLA